MDAYCFKIVLSYEVKCLQRDKLLKLFAALAFLGIVLCEFTYMKQNLDFTFSFHLPWQAQALPSSIPYLSAAYFNMIQLIAAIFIGTNDLNRDRLNTMATLMTRPASNGDFILGRFAGKMIVFGVILAIVFSLMLFINFIIALPSCNPLMYIYYSLTSVLPSLLFTLGLSSFIVTIVRHQGLAIFILLTIVLGGCWWGADIDYGVFDPLARKFPNVLSTMTGHPDSMGYLLHRSLYAIAGCGFLLLSLARQKRLSDMTYPPRIVFTGGIAVMGIALLLGITFHFRYSHRDRMRSIYKQLFEENEYTPKARILRHVIYLKEVKSGIYVQSRIRVTNRNVFAIPLIFYLNPGLQVDRLTCGGKLLPFRRVEQMVYTDRIVNASDTLDIELTYSGKIDENICFPEIDRSAPKHMEVNGSNGFYYGYRAAFCERNYKLFTPECLWYPVCVPPVHLSASREENFTRYLLTVEHEKGKTVISQGYSSRVSDQRVKFRHHHNLQGISLCIGKYKHRTLTIDSTKIELFYTPGSKFLLDRINYYPYQSIKPWVHDLKNEMDEQALGNYEYAYRKKTIKYSREKFVPDFNQQYPYRWLKLFEVPVSFYCYPREATNGGERVQCGLVYMPERLSESHFNLFASDMMHTFFEKGQYNLTPTFQGKTYFVQSDKFRQVNEVLSLTGKVSTSEKIMEFPPEKIYLLMNYMNEHSLNEALQDKELSPGDKHDILVLKCIELRGLISLQVPLDDFNNFCISFFSRYIFKELPFQIFNEEFKHHFSFDFEKLLEQWYESKILPVLQVKNEQVVTIPHTKKNWLHDVIYQFEVYNQGEINAFVMTDDEHFWLIPPHRGKKVSVKKKQNPFIEKISYFIATPMSLNLPATYMLYESYKGVIDTTERVLEIDSVTFFSGEEGIVVDNEDEGFRILNNPKQPFFARIQNKKAQNKYLDHQTDKWKFTIHEDFYGHPIRSACTKLAGNGNAKVEWSTCLPRTGTYRVYVYCSLPYSDMKDITGKKQYYTVINGKKENEAILDIDSVEEAGWVLLGSFYFPEKEAKVILDDRGGNVHIPLSCEIIADAVKWQYIP